MPQEHCISVGELASLWTSAESMPFKYAFKCREIEEFNKFLRTRKKLLLNGCNSQNSDSCFQIIHSEANFEVSSAVAAICMAWLLGNASPPLTDKTWHSVPIINIPRHDMQQHKDAAWLFDVCGIDSKALVFSDEIIFDDLIAAGCVKMTVIGQDILATRNEVGSCCTLLAERFLKEAQSLMQVRYVKTLLLAGILLDTENLQIGSARDKEMATMLLVGSSSLGRNGFFNQLRRVQNDSIVSNLVTAIYGKTVLPGREEEAEQSDKDSLFSQSGDGNGQTSSISDAGTSSNEYSPAVSPSKLNVLHKRPASCLIANSDVAANRQVATDKSNGPGNLQTQSTFSRLCKKLF